MRLSSVNIGSLLTSESESLMQEFKSSGKIILRDKVLLSPGNWNGLEFTSDQISKAFIATDWTDKDNFALIYDHDEKASNWLGNVTNIRLLSDSLVGDLEIFDENLARKLTIGGAKLGISARVLGSENKEGEFENFTFNNFSVVYDPACKNAYINLSKSKAIEMIAQIRKDLDIIELDITSSSSVSGSEIGNAKVNQKIKYDIKKKKKKDEDLLDEEKEEESDSHDLKGGNNLSDSKMEKEEEKTEQVEEVSKEEVVKSPEAPAVKAEVKEVVAEESEELKASKNLSSKLDLVLKQVEELSAKVSKLEEAKVEEPEEAEVEVEEKSETEAEATPENLSKEAKVSMSVIELGNARSMAKGYSAGELEFAQLLSEGTRLA